MPFEKVVLVHDSSQLPPAWATRNIAVVDCGPKRKERCAILPGVVEDAALAFAAQKQQMTVAKRKPDATQGVAVLPRWRTPIMEIMKVFDW